MRSSVPATCATSSGGMRPGCPRRARARGRHSGPRDRAARRGSRGIPTASSWSDGARKPTDQVRHSVSAIAVVRDVGRQVEHVAGLEHPLLLGLEARQDAQVQARHEAEVLLPRDLPAPPPRALDEEDVVGVDVRADGAAGNGVAHHEVVDARARHEGEAFEECGGPVAEVIGVLDEHRPVACAGAVASARAREGAVLEGPPVAPARRTTRDSASGDCASASTSRDAQRVAETRETRRARAAAASASGGAGTAPRSSGRGSRRRRFCGRPEARPVLARHEIR